MPALGGRPVGLVEADRLWRDARLDYPQCCLHVPALDARGTYVFLQSTQGCLLADGHHLCVQSPVERLYRNVSAGTFGKQCNVADSFDNEREVFLMSVP